MLKEGGSLARDCHRKIWRKVVRKGLEEWKVNKQVPKDKDGW